MRIAYLECFSGMSGDMFMGALVDAGVSPRLLEDAVKALGVEAQLEISRVVRSGIAAAKGDVWVDGEKDMPREEFWGSHGDDHKDTHHPHSHAQREHGSHSHSAGDEGSRPVSATVSARADASHEHTTHHHAPHEHSHGRALSEIKRIITAAGISESAKKTAIAVFEALGAAEAKIHATSVEKVHFHEVGAVDAMVDIVCAAVGAEALGVDEIICSPLNVGGGTVKCAHGTLPVPAPATLELLKNAPVYSSGIQAELVTPTGAAIVTTLAKRFSSFPAMTVEKIGHGAGTREFEGHANLLRLTMGEARPEAVAQELITVLEANIDDLNPQVFGYVMDRLLEEGAWDAFGMPVQMKKNRPGMLLTVLCRNEDTSKLADIIFAETTTLGVRQREEKRRT